MVLGVGGEGELNRKLNGNWLLTNLTCLDT
jgi:hypothetical protein